MKGRHGMRRRERSTKPHRRPELQMFAATMRELRASLEREQGAMANHFDVSQRTLSDW
jgi:hypothetical protein